MDNKQNDWIPTSDLTNLPKEREEVIISVRTDRGSEYVTSAHFHIEKGDTFIAFHFGGYDIKEVVAWQPMPEPYGGGDTECTR